MKHVSGWVLALVTLFSANANAELFGLGSGEQRQFCIPALGMTLTISHLAEPINQNRLNVTLEAQKDGGSWLADTSLSTFGNFEPPPGFQFTIVGIGENGFEANYYKLNDDEWLIEEVFDSGKIFKFRYEPC